MSTEQAQALERDLRNAGRRAYRAGDHDKSDAYRYAAYLVRQAIKANA